MEHPDITTKVKHSSSQNSWNITGPLGGKYIVARVPYLTIVGNEVLTEVEKNEALRHATFISFCFNNPDKINLND